MKSANLLRTARNIYKDISLYKTGIVSKHIFKKTENLYYPLDDKHILQRLKGEHETFSIVEFFRHSNDHEAIAFFNEYRTHLPNPSMNPHKYYESLNYWIEPQKITKIFDDQILGYTHKNVHTHILHVGEKGVGKTLTQNCWLHSRFSDLEKRKIFWVRCDGYKLFKLWSEPNAQQSDKLTTLEEYLDMQLIYVFSKYYDQDFFKEIFKNIKKDNITFQHIKGKIFGNFDNAKMEEHIQIFHQDIWGYERNRSKADDKASYALYILKEAQAKRTGIDRARWNLISLSHSLQNFLLTKGYMILEIVDGIDNINLIDPYIRPFYDSLVKQTANFIYNGESPQVMKMVSLRERTSIDVRMAKAQMAISDKDRDNIHILPIFHTSPDFKQISNKRWSYIESKVNERSDVQGKFSEYLRVGLKQKYIHNLNDYYHNNVSTYLYNNCSLSMKIYYRWLQSNRPSDFLVDTYAEIFRSRNLFLNGRFYLHSKDIYPDATKKGLFSFNLFYSEPNYNGKNLPAKWQGLCNIRIIQLLSGVAPHQLTEIKVVEYIQKLFHYSQIQIEKSLDLCKNFGLIDTKLGQDQNPLVYLDVSEKGKYVIDLIFSDLDVLYVLALDTYLPESFRGFINAHSNKFHEETRYASSSIITVFLFLLFIIHIHNEELKILANKDFVLNTNKADYALPIDKHFSNLVKRAYRLYKIVSPDEKKIIEDFFASMNNLLNKK